MSILHRRRFLGLSAAGVSALGIGQAMAQAPAAPAAPGAAPAAAAQPWAGYPLPAPKLDYDFNALEPHIDAKTMEIHSTKHHAAYVNNFNEILKKYPQLATKAPHEILGNMQAVPEEVRIPVRNNLGGHVNHTMFWQIMGPNGGQPEGELLAAINEYLGGVDKMKQTFNGFGARQFGSGWAFITVSREGRLTISSNPNQDSPLMNGLRVLMGNDVWEHAYYLNYQNRRADYLNAWWNTVNWKVVGERYAAAKKGELLI